MVHGNGIQSVNKIKKVYGLKISVRIYRTIKHCLSMHTSKWNKTEEEKRVPPECRCTAKLKLIYYIETETPRSKRTDKQN